MYFCVFSLILGVSSTGIILPNWSYATDNLVDEGGIVSQSKLASLLKRVPTITRVIRILYICEYPDKVQEFSENIGIIMLYL